MFKAIDVVIRYITPVLGVNPGGDVGVSYLEERIKKEIERVERMLGRVKDAVEREVLEVRLDRLQKELMSLSIDGVSEGDRRVKVFLRDEDGALCWAHYQIKGHLKEVAQYRMGEGWLRNAISRFVDIFPWGWDFEKGDWSKAGLIPILRDGEPVKQADGILSRTLTSWVGLQRITTITSSEMINPPAWLKFRVIIWDVGRGDKVVTADHILSIMKQGVQWGHSGWRTARYGRYVVEEFCEVKVES
jgi:hypothetical protein